MSRIPLSTYRIQFNPCFDFKKAIEIVEYLSVPGDFGRLCLADLQGKGGEFSWL